MPKNSMIDEGFALWRAAMRWQRAIDASLSSVELTHTQYLVLTTAAQLTRDMGDALTQRAIAQHAGLDEATTSRVVGVLVERGLLDRGPTAGDGRAWRVLVTRSGRAVLRRAAPRVEAAAKRFFSESGEAQPQNLAGAALAERPGSK